MCRQLLLSLKTVFLAFMYCIINSHACLILLQRQIAELEIQKYKLTVEMKNEEIEYWKSLAESSDDKSLSLS